MASRLAESNSKEEFEIQARFTFSRQRRSWLLHVVLLRAAEKCTKNYNALAQPLFTALKRLFSNVAVVVLVFLSSLISFVCFAGSINIETSIYMLKIIQRNRIDDFLRFGDRNSTINCNLYT